MQPWFKDLEDTLSLAERRVARKASAMDALTHVEPSKAATHNVKPKDQVFEREEIKQRMADFKATQRRFEIERDEFFKNAMASLRASSLKL
jgi:hypothetical protein